MKTISLLIVTLLLSTAVQADIYRWTDAGGQVHYGDRPPAGSGAQRQAEPVTTPGPASADYYRVSVRPPAPVETYSQARRRLCQAALTRVLEWDFAPESVYGMGAVKAACTAPTR